ncbi:MAG TPA: ABC transporter substrate-binding protein, partial [Prochlorococcus sp.]
MQRRKLLGSGATALSAAVGAGLLSACTIRKEQDSISSSNQPQVRWRMATSWPHSLDTIYGGAETISRRVNELSGGNFQIKPYAG